MAPLERDTNALGAISRGTIDGLNLAVNVGAMLISFIALIYLVDGMFGLVHNGLAHIGHWLVSFERRANFRLAFFADRVGDRHSLARLPHHRKSAGSCAW